MSTIDDTAPGNDDGANGGVRNKLNQSGTPNPVPGLSIDEVMWRVRAEVAHRRKVQFDHVTTSGVCSEIRSFDLSMPRWNPAVRSLTVRDKYELAELLALSDTDFIDLAFRAILRYPPDEQRYYYYLQCLRNGEMSRVVILGGFLSSADGQSSGVRVQGLYLPYLLERWRRKRFIGPIVHRIHSFLQPYTGPIADWIHALLRLGTLEQRHKILNVNQAPEIQEVGRIINEASDCLLQRIIELKVESAGRVGAAEFEALKNQHEKAAAKLSELSNEVERIRSVITGNLEASAPSVQQPPTRDDQA